MSVTGTPDTFANPCASHARRVGGRVPIQGNR